MNYSELIAKLITLSEMLDEYEGGNFKWSEEAATAREAADALQAMERVPMTTSDMVNVVKAAGWSADVTDRQLIAAFNLIEATEAHHGITPPESI